MEVCIIVDQKDDNGVYQKFFDAVFLMVARDPMNKGSAKINPLIAETKEEEEFLKKGTGKLAAFFFLLFHSILRARMEESHCRFIHLARQQLRKKQEEENIFKTPPNLEEQKIIHGSFINKMISSSDSVVNRKKMKDTVLKTVLICQPQVRAIL